MTTRHPLDLILNPQSVAVIGASSEPARIGGRPVFYSKGLGFAGPIYPVNPGRDEIQGLKSYKSIKDVPEPVDCAVVAVPAALVLQTMHECAQAGVRSVVMFSSGFAEVGDEGVGLQAAVVDFARTAGIRLVGPNCLGVANRSINWYGTFADMTHAGRIADKIDTAIVSQSGAYGAHLLLAAKERGLSANYIVTTGNEGDIDVASVIDYYAECDDVKTIMAYVEGVKDGERMRKALAKAQAARKPVVIMKVGQSETGARAAESHTASIAGEDRIYDALFAQYGAWRPSTTAEMVEIAYALQIGGLPTGDRVCLQTISGGAGILMADVSEQVGLQVPMLQDDLQAELKALIPQAGVTNPVDFTANAVNKPETMIRNLELTLSRGGFNSHLIYIGVTMASPFMQATVLKILQQIRAQFPDEKIMLCGFASDEHQAAYEALGMPCFRDPSLMIRVAGVLAAFNRHFDRQADQSATLSPVVSVDEMPLAPEGLCTELEAKQVLSACGIAIPAEKIAQTADEAVAFAASLSGACVMKIASVDIAHKTEMGGVLLGIEGERAVRQGFTTLLERAAAAHPDARIDGVLVAETVPPGVEAVIGMTHDPVFGPAVMVGLGGIFVEVLKDVAFRLAPFGKDEARQMIDQLAGRAVFDGVRGAKAVNVDALADALSRLSVFADKNRDTLDSIDVNPIVLTGDRAVAVDGLIIPKAK
ncbi:MAG: acetate--CoA ligase family protein [Burkholderiaceae bacterium]